MTCPKCGSENVSVQAITQIKRRSCLVSVLWILAAMCTFGIVLLLIPILRNGSKSKMKTVCVCQTCGYRWYK